MGHPSIIDDDVTAFHRDGFVIKRAYFSVEEIAMIAEALRGDPALQQRAYGLADGQGGTTIIALWNHPGDDTLGVVPRLDRMAGGMERLLGGEVYHYHSKVTSKAAGGGGTWDWHQDYGYWYQNGCLFPDMGSVAIAVSAQTPRTVRCACCAAAIAVAASSTRSTAASRAPTCAASPSSRNASRRSSSMPRRATRCSSTATRCTARRRTRRTAHATSCCVATTGHRTTRTSPHHHPGYTPLNRVDDDTLLRTGLVMSGHDREFMDPADDISIGEFTTAPAP